MSRAEIYIEDSDSQPGAGVRFVFPEGFTPESHAHQLANIIRMKLDEMVKAGELTPLSEREEQGDMSAANDDLAQRERAIEEDLAQRERAIEEDLAERAVAAEEAAAKRE